VVAGPNGSGKSNLLEALAYPSLCRSFRGARDAALLRNGAPFFWVKARARDAEGVRREVAVLYRHGQKQWDLDGRRTPSVWDAVGRMRVVSFCWGDIALVRGGPAPLRSYLDAVASQLERSHLEELRGFLRSVRQRNGLLGQHASDQMLEPWEAVLARHAVAVGRGRRKALRAINSSLPELFSTISGFEGRLWTMLISDIEVSEDGTDEEHIGRYREVLSASRDRDRVVGHTTRGTHRDRANVLLREQDLRRYGSDGEQKIAALCLRLAQADAAAGAGEKPVLVLDDPLAGLDSTRVEGLARFIEARGGQTFVSCQDTAQAQRFGKPLLLVEAGSVWRAEAA
jgi:DNA replication and repair protein RecF